MTASPFKFLDAYDAADGDRFFGRDREVELLYQLLGRDDLVLVYGPSGTGKTSLIQCGLARRLRDVDRFPVFVRRRDDLNTSLRAALARAGRTPIAKGTALPDAVHSVFLDFLRPVHLIFDQFEELLLLGTDDERHAFFADLAGLLDARARCKVLISMREEYFALLSPFEAQLPSLFQSRMRVEPMTHAALIEVVQGTTDKAGIALEHGAATAERIVARLGTDARGAFQLPYLQVYLDRLYRTAEPPTLFTDALVDRVGGLTDVMASFFDEQVAATQAELAAGHPGTPANATQLFLQRFITDEGTRRPIARTDAEAGDTRLPAAVARDALAALERGRLLRSDDDGVCELAHDSLAKLVDDRRGADERALARIARLVRDRMASAAQVRNPWLTDEELALVRHALPQLGLTPVEAAFVAQSTARRRRGRRIAWGIAAAVMLALAGAAAFAWRAEGRARATIAAAERGLNTLTRQAYLDLRTLPQTDAINERTMRLAGSINEALVAGSAAASSRARYWPAIQAGDRAIDDGDDAQAWRQFSDAVHAADAVLAAAPADATWQNNLVMALERSSRVPSPDADPARSARLLDRARVVAERLAAEDPNDADREQQAARMIMLRARRDTDFDTADKRFTEASDRFKALAAKKPGIELRSEWAVLELGWATAALKQAQAWPESNPDRRDILDAARGQLDNARTFLQSLLAYQTFNIVWLKNIATLTDTYAKVEIAAGNPARARAQCREGVGYLDDIIALDPRVGHEDAATRLALDQRIDLLDCHGLGTR